LRKVWTIMIWSAGKLLGVSIINLALCRYPPGHGSFYESFYNSGFLDKFINAGKKYCFLSNIDNLGATVDLVSSGLILLTELFPEHSQLHGQRREKAGIRNGSH
jgi:UTP--glucose-1-phosphate uridylyltransferase